MIKCRKMSLRRCSRNWVPWWYQVSQTPSIGKYKDKALVQLKTSFCTEMNHMESDEPNESSHTSNFIKAIPSNASSNLDCICERFALYTGGSFKLTKNEEENYAVLRICNPSKKNAVSGDMMVQLRSILTDLGRWHMGKALIIQGEDNFFCSGGDQTTVKQILNHEGGKEMGILMQDNLRRLEALPMLTLAVIQGKAIGGGAEFATACDFRLMTPSAEIGFVHVNLGITAGWGGGTRLVRLLGPSKALHLMSSGQRLKAEDALKCGLATHVFDLSECDENNTNSVLEAARQWIKTQIAGSVETIQSIKSIVHNARTLSLQEALEKELEIFASVWGGPDHKKALAQNVKHR